MFPKSGRSGSIILNLPDLENYLELGVHVQTATAPRCVLFIFELTSGPSTLGEVGLPPIPTHAGARYPLIPQISASAAPFPISWLVSLSLDCIQYITIKLKEGKLIIIVCRKYKYFQLDNERQLPTNTYNIINFIIIIL